MEPPGYGLVYKLSGSAQAATVLFRFPGVVDGFSPFSTVIRDSAGELYGTTNTGGATADGTVYQVSASGSETVLYSFRGGADGSYPYGDVARDANGNLYGTTWEGGADNGGVGYRLTPDRVETILHSFTDGDDGGLPFSGVTLDSAGNLYGTAYLGGTNFSGVLYKIDPREWKLFSITSPKARTVPDRPAASRLDSGGNIYGATSYGGPNGGGVVYKIAPNGDEAVLYAFTGGADGSAPESTVTLDSNGNVYGTSTSGGNGFGVVYKINPNGTELFSTASLAEQMARILSIRASCAIPPATHMALRNRVGLITMAWFTGWNHRVSKPFSWTSTSQTGRTLSRA